MNARQPASGIDRQVYITPGGNRLTIEATDPGDQAVHLWTWTWSDGGNESGVSLPAEEARKLADDLRARADLIDPPTDTAAPAAQTGA